MGGHGALTIALKNPDRFKSVAFAPIVQPSTAGWSRPALEKYLGPDEQAWRAYDATLLIETAIASLEILVDQGTADGFLDDGLRPWLLEEACRKAGIALTLNMREAMTIPISSSQPSWATICAGIRNGCAARAYLNKDLERDDDLT
ncbi:alpha/beta hydrolase-fold protein [Brucella abortus]|nr:alpha/beta hydrolase-fold protein [Brucella abortus]